MTLIRCLVQPFQLDDVVDALVAFDLSSMTVMGAGERLRQGSAKDFYRGTELKGRLTPIVVIDLTAPDDAVDDIVDVVTKVCASSGHPSPDVQIFVFKVEEGYRIQAGRRRIA